MAGESLRPFTVGDAMILVAAAALGTLAMRVTFPDLSTLWSRLIQLIKDRPAGWRHFHAIQFYLSVVFLYLAPLTPAMLIVRLRPPRPGLRRVGRQPGSIACVVATVALALDYFWIASLAAQGSGFIFVTSVIVEYAQKVGYAVMGGWLALALSGRWRSEPGWVDRMGCLVGITWIGVTVLSWSRYLVT